MLDQVRYQLVKNDLGAHVWDRQDRRFITIAMGHVFSVENVVIDGIDYVLGDDGESLYPVPPEGALFRVNL